MLIAERLLNLDSMKMYIYNIGLCFLASFVVIQNNLATAASSGTTVNCSIESSIGYHDRFPCGDGTCVKTTDLCDRVDNCANGLDEKNETCYTSVFNHDASLSVCRRRHTCETRGCSTVTDDHRDALLCRCDPLCHTFDDCCYDYDTVCQISSETTDSQIENNYVQSLGIKSSQFACISPDDNGISYRLVAKCPDSYTETEIIDKCLSYSNVNNTYNRIPVIADSKISFANVFCAVCNGINVSQSVVAWNVQYGCGRRLGRAHQAALHGAPISTILDYFETTCEVTITPPAQFAESVSRRCASVTQCPNQHHEAYQSCNSYTAFVFFNDSGTVLAFRNPHCVLCFTNEHTPSDLRCVKNKIPGYGGEYDKVTTPKHPGIPLSVLFDFGRPSHVKLTLNNMIMFERFDFCNKHQVFDIYSGVCRVISCQGGFVIQNNTCVPEPSLALPQCSSSDDTISLVISIAENSTFGNNGSINACVQALSDSVTLKTTLGLTNDTNIQQLSNWTIAIDISNTKPFADIEQLLSKKIPAIADELNSSVCMMYRLDLLNQCNGIDTEEYRCGTDWVEQNNIIWSNDSIAMYINGTQTSYDTNKVKISFSSTDNFKTYTKQLFVNRCSIVSTFSCTLVSLPLSMFKILDVEGASWLQFLTTGDTFSPGDFILDNNNDSVQICSTIFDNTSKAPSFDTFSFSFSEYQAWVSLIGNIVSIILSVATIVTLYMFPELRTRGSLLITGVVLTLIISQLNFVIGGYLVDYPIACSASAILGHFTWLSGFAFMNTVAFDLSYTFGSTLNKKVMALHRERYAAYFAYAIGAPAVVVIPCMVVYFCDCANLPFLYGDDTVCWIRNGVANLVSFGCPVGVFLFINCLLYARTIRGIHHSRAKTNLVRKVSALQGALQELQIYLKISCLMGFTWLWGYATAFTDIESLWYLFIITNSMQGVFIFWAFCLSGKALTLWRLKCCCCWLESTRGNSLPNGRSRPNVQHNDGSSTRTATLSVSGSLSMSGSMHTPESSLRQNHVFQKTQKV